MGNHSQREPVLIFEKSQPGRHGTSVRVDRGCPCGAVEVPAKLKREAPLPLPEVSLALFETRRRAIGQRIC